MDPHHAFDLASSYGSYSMLAYHDVQQTYVIYAVPRSRICLSCDLVRDLGKAHCLAQNLELRTQNNLFIQHRN
jgi:hypothetical protein